VLTLDRVVRRGSQQAHLIPMPFTGLQRVGFGLARGAVGMIAAAPGVGKSALGLSIALATDARVLYESPDTDSWTMTVRAIAHLSGHPQSYVSSCLEGGFQLDEIELAMFEAGHVQFSFDSYTTQEIRDDVLAYATVHGDYPELIVIDTLMNVARGGEDELRSQSKAMDEFHALAQMTGAHVLVLHHVSGQYNDGDRPVPLSGPVNQVTKLPSQVLTLFRKEQFVYVCVVKNRNGRADPTAQMQVRLRFDPERMKFYDQE
jgi:replicative DNA helicase